MWHKNKQTTNLAEVLITEKQGIKPIDAKAGRYGGTYACKERVYAHAMWISPASICVHIF
jgi:KilA-N domain